MAVGWLAWQLTGSGTWLGILAVAEVAPAIVAGPVAGAMGDRANRVRIMLLAQSVSMCVAVTLSLLALAQELDIVLLVILVTIKGFAIGCNQPNRLALVPRLVDRSQLTTALALNSIAFNVARFVGPVIAGVAIGMGGAALAFAFNAVSFLVFLAVLLSVPRDLGEPSGDGSEPGGFLATLVEGCRFAAGHQTIAVTLLLLTALGLGVRSYVELLPGFAESVFGQAVGGLALLASAVGVGAVCGGLTLAGRTSSKSVVRGLTWPPLAACASVLLFATSDTLALAVCWAAGAGFFIAVSSISAQTLIQLTVPEQFRGRVMSLYGLLFRSSPALGALAIGAISEFAGLGPPLAAAALLSALACAALSRWQGALLADLERKRES